MSHHSFVLFGLAEVLGKRGGHPAVTGETGGNAKLRQRLLLDRMCIGEILHKLVAVGTLTHSSPIRRELASGGRAADAASAVHRRRLARPCTFAGRASRWSCSTTIAALPSPLDGLASRVAHACLEVAGVLRDGFLRGFSCGVGGTLCQLLAVLDRLATNLPCLVLHLVGQRSEMLVLEPACGKRHAEQKSRGHGPDRETEWVLLDDAGTPACGPRGVAGELAPPVACRSGGTRHLLFGVRNLAGDGILLVFHISFDSSGDVCLGRQRFDRVSHPLAGVFYSLLDVAWVFAHCTSSFTDSIVCVGAGGVAWLIRSFPRRARRAAAAAYTAVTINAASHPGTHESSPSMRKPIDPPTAASPNTAAPDNIPAPIPAC